MQDETLEWIAKLEEAVRAGEWLPEMSFQDRKQVIWLMRMAGRHDLASEAVRHIPIPRGPDRSQPLREFLRMEREAQDAEEALTTSTSARPSAPNARR